MMSIAMKYVVITIICINILINAQQIITTDPTNYPTTEPSINPSFEPSFIPTKAPTINPTKIPTRNPSAKPTTTPTKLPTVTPTLAPYDCNSYCMTVPYCEYPSASPTNYPTIAPSSFPTTSPTITPTFKPTKKVVPTLSPGKIFVGGGTDSPSLNPTSSPTSQLDFIKSTCLATPFCNGDYSIPGYSDLTNPAVLFLSIFCKEQSYCILPTNSPTTSPTLIN